MEGECSSEKRAITRENSGFLGPLFSWSLQDIFNDNLYKNQVERIPDSFQSIESYFGSYVLPLLEETRAAMCSSLKIIGRAPYAKVTKLAYAKVTNLVYAFAASKDKNYDIHVDYWRNRLSDNGKEPYRMQPGDLLILSDIKPETVSDLQRVTWTFVLVTNVLDYNIKPQNSNVNSNTSTCFEVKPQKDIESEEWLQKSSSTCFEVKPQKDIESEEWLQKPSFYVVFLMNITTNRRIWNALHMYKTLNKNLNIIKDVLCPAGSMENMGFIDTVFSWSLEDIFNDNLYKDQIEKIPASFQSVEHYFGSYFLPLLEDTRAAICSSMEIIARAPYAEVTKLSEAKPHGGLLFDVNVDYWRNRFSDRVKEPYKTLPGDIFIIADAKPESASDLQRIGRTWTFALVTCISEDDDEDNSSCTSFKVEAPEDIASKYEIQNSLFVVFLRNVTTNRRIWNALHMKRNLRVIKEVLHSGTAVSNHATVLRFASVIWNYTG
ncbi:hypothetical protein CCACVL1_23908 [Corchorus capsularis]|uniref:DUF6469 domain-containing protein n=1 Tax=Corchorus capsularis TaxID=210143 RepID=A0A1R3GRN4_COCAP|nr:hypothetical protein CCACVL1_23908 [Corchorus capsularis]